MLTVLLLLLTGACAAAYGGWVWHLHRHQEALVFFPTREVQATPADAGLPYEAITLRTADGESLAAWFVPHPAPRATVLFLHGNSGNLGDTVTTLRVLHELGCAVFAIDYRGYGQSTGSPSEAGLYADATAAWDHLTRARGIAAADIIVHGRSLGGGPASWLAERSTPGALVLESTFVSLPALARFHYPLIPTAALVRLRFDTLARLPRIRVPTLVLHGRDDEVVPYAHGRQLAAAATDLRGFVELQGPHGSGFADHPQPYAEGLGRFLDAWAQRRPRSNTAIDST